MEEAGLFGIGHLDRSVSDVEASAAWYEKVLGLRRLQRVDFFEPTMIVLRHDASGLVVGLNQHQGSPGEPFDERRAGLDHVGFTVGRRQDLDSFQVPLAALGVEHSPVVDTEVGAALVFRDPHHIQLELWWSKPAGNAPTSFPADRGVIERSSPLRVDETVRRLADAFTAAGAMLFAAIDHAAGARSVGLEMPETQVLIVPLGASRRCSPPSSCRPASSSARQRRVQRTARSPSPTRTPSLGVTGPAPSRSPGWPRSSRWSTARSGECPIRSDRCIAGRTAPARRPAVDGIMASGMSR
jgi:glyoxylase I family protein